LLKTKRMRNWTTFHASVPKMLSKVEAQCARVIPSSLKLESNFRIVAMMKAKTLRSVATRKATEWKFISLSFASTPVKLACHYFNVWKVTMIQIARPKAERFQMSHAVQICRFSTRTWTIIMMVRQVAKMTSSKVTSRMRVILFSTT